MCSPVFSDHDLNSRTLDEDASLALSPFPGLGRGAEDKLVRHEHSFEIEPDWRRGGQGLVCGMGAAESLNAAASHDVMFSTSCDSDKFGWFGGAVVSSFIFHRKENCQICRCCKLLLISGVFLQGFNQRDLQVLVKLNVLWSEDFRSKVLSVERSKSRPQSDLSLPPGLGRGTADQQVRHEHQLGIQRHWCRGCQGVVCGCLR